MNTNNFYMNQVFEFNTPTGLYKFFYNNNGFDVYKFKKNNFLKIFRLENLNPKKVTGEKLYNRFLEEKNHVL